MRIIGFLLMLFLISCSKDAVKYNAKTYDWCNDIIGDFEQNKKSGLSSETYHWCTMLMSEAGIPITVKPPPSAPVAEMSVENEAGVTSAQTLLSLTKEEIDFEPNQNISPESIKTDLNSKKGVNSNVANRLEHDKHPTDFSEQAKISTVPLMVPPTLDLEAEAKDQFNLALNYFHGQGVQQDYISAHMLLTLAERNGEEDASDYKLAVTERMTMSQIQEAQQRVMLYDAKENRTKQPVNGATESEDLAEDPFNLGLMYFQGKGVPQDYVMALMLFDIAATSGNQEALYYRDAVSERMEPSEIRRADGLALEWSKQHP